MLDGAAILAAGFLLGRFLPARRRRPKAPEPIEPVCGCKHHHSFHDPKTGICHGTKGVAAPRADYNIPQHYVDIPCTCRQYTGPEPLPTYFAPEIQ